jgi:alkanesulfonate monooxygenase SsuD/methylene tetrahydromethanopterin reductase-like flavin-dependent oxidoreductase (luciferase family)
MIDVLSRGRLVSGFLRGGFTEWYAYSLEASETRGRFEEAWELIVKCWTEPDVFAWHGQFFNYDNISIMPRPVQQPHPQIVMAGSTAESIEWAARHRAPIASSFAPVDSMQETFAYYRKYAQEQCGWTPGPEHAMVSRQVYVAPTMQQAREEAEGYLLGFFDEVPTARKLAPRVEEYRRSGRSARSYDYKSDQTAGHQFLADAKATATAAPSQGPSGNYTFEQLQRDGLCIIGDPDYVTQEIKRQQSVLGVGTFLTYTPFGMMPLNQATKSIDLFAKEVLPHLKS